jgi:tRNA threonylcarbamoyladenosine biosynthesis protein TsaB
MPFSLSIVACGPQLEIALSGPSLGVISVVRFGGIQRRSSLVLAAVDLLVEDAGMARSDLWEVIVSRGPGSFTGIRSGLATAGGLAAAVGCKITAYDSLVMQAARVGGSGEVWAAQPGRRGEVYARAFLLSPETVPEPRGEIEVLPLADIGERGPWVSAESLSLGEAPRQAPIRSAAEALILLAEAGIQSDEVEPLYIEGPPIHGGQGA